MKAALFLALLGVCAVCPVGAAQCVGTELQLQSVRAALAAEQTAKADAILETLKQADADCPDAILFRAQTLYLKGETSAAQEAFLRYIDLAPDNARGYAGFARVLLDEQEYARADASSLLALQKAPGEPAALAVRGQILGMKGQPEEGVRLLEQACQLEPGDAEANFQLGALYAQAQRHGDAVERFRKSLAAAPANARAWDYLALNLEPLGQYDAADDAYRKAEAVNAPQGRHYDGFLDYNYGRFLAKRNQPDAAEQHLAQAVKLAPDTRAVWYELGKVNLSMKKLTDARTDAEKAASLPDPGGVILDLQIYTLLQQVYQRLGEVELAKKYADLSRSTPVPVREEGR